MQVIELVGVILALPIEVLAKGIFAQLLKAISKEMTVWLSSHGFLTARELYCLAKPTHSGVLAPTSLAEG